MKKQILIITTFVIVYLTSLAPSFAQLNGLPDGGNKRATVLEQVGVALCKKSTRPGK